MKILVSRRTTVLSIFQAKNIRTEWQDKCFECKECNCQFQLQSGDESKIFARIEEVDGGVIGVNDCLGYYVFCPEGCGTMVEIGSSFPTQDEYKQLPKRIEPYGGTRRG